MIHFYGSEKVTYNGASVRDLSRSRQPAVNRNRAGIKNLIFNIRLNILTPAQIKT